MPKLSRGSRLPLHFVAVVAAVPIAKGFGEARVRIWWTAEGTDLDVAVNQHYEKYMTEGGNRPLRVSFVAEATRQARRTQRRTALETGTHDEDAAPQANGAALIQERRKEGVEEGLKARFGEGALTAISAAVGDGTLSHNITHTASKTVCVCEQNIKCSVSHLESSSGI